jgi:hypothetical protein
MQRENLTNPVIKRVANNWLYVKSFMERYAMTAKTINHENLEKEKQLLSSEERAILSQVATLEAPYSQRAQALLAIDEGTTQAEAGHQAGLTKGQVRYWLGKFRKEGTSIFPAELVNQAQPVEEEEAQQELQDVEESTEPVDEATAQQENAPKAKKKGKKESKKKSKKGKKPKKDKKKKKGKKSKKKGSKKGKGAKGKSGKKAGKNALKKGKKKK